MNEWIISGGKIQKWCEKSKYFEDCYKAEKLLREQRPRAKYHRYDWDDLVIDILDEHIRSWLIDVTGGKTSPYADKQNPAEVDSQTTLAAVNNMLDMAHTAMMMPRRDDPPSLDDPTSMLGIPKEGR
jgi:hypothetical protein